MSSVTKAEHAGREINRTPATRVHLVTSLLMVIVAIGLGIPLRLRGGEVPALAVVALFGYPLMLASIATDRFLRSLWGLTFLWVVVQMISNVHYGTKMLTIAIIAGPTIAVIVTVLRLIRRDPSLLLLAASAGWTIFAVVGIGSDAARGYWKYGLGVPVAIVVLASAWRRRWGGGRVVLALLVLAGISFVYDSRFYELTFVFAAVVVVAVRTERASEPQEGHRRRHHGGSALIAVVALVALYFAYPVVARHGWAGARAQAQQQSFDSTGTNYLIANRPELPQALYIVGHNPVLGIGANGILSTDEANGALQFDQSLGVSINVNSQNYLLDNEDSQRGYALHSAALDSAIQAGVLALPFWLFLLWTVMRGLRGFRTREPALRAILVVLVVTTVWNALFSPLVTLDEIGFAIALFLATSCGGDQRDRPAVVDPA